MSANDATRIIRNRGWRRKIAIHVIKLKFIALRESLFAAFVNLNRRVVTTVVKVKRDRYDCMDFTSRACAVPRCLAVFHFIFDKICMVKRKRAFLVSREYALQNAVKNWHRCQAETSRNR